MFLSSQLQKRKSEPAKHKQATGHLPLIWPDNTDRLMLALEPRFLYDAAGLIAGLELIPQQEHPDTAPDSHPDPVYDISSDASPDHPAQESGAGFLSILDSIMAPAPPAVESPTAVVFVDPAVHDYESLVGDVTAGTLVIALDPDTDGVTQIGDVLARYNDIEAVHIISHGDAGRVFLGDAELSNQTIEDYAGTLRNWGTALAPGADILIYGCNVADGLAGQSFVAQMADITGADVAASDDPTGAADRGGDWDLEVNRGPIDYGVAVSSAGRAGYTGLLANYEVTSINDSGPGTLREALSSAVNDGDTVSFDAALDGQTINLNSPLYFYGNVAIDNDDISGPGDGNPDVDITISGQNKCRVLSNYYGYNVAIDGLDIRDGKAFSGGGIYNYGGTVNIYDSTISYNNSGFAGGGIYNYGGTVNIYDSTISYNNTGFAGGGIENYSGTLYISGSTISDNKAFTGPGGGIENYSYASYGYAIATVYNSKILNNYAYYGGGIMNNGASSTLQVDSSTISYNTAYYSGGGIENNLGTVYVTTGSAISNNKAHAGDGGGIENNSGTVTVDSSYILSNTAYRWGGGIYSREGTATITGSAISGNSAGDRGGGVYNRDGTATITNSNIYGNKAYYGGGIWNRSGAYAAIVDSSKIYGNQAYYGGGIWNNAALTIQNYSSIYGNQAYYGGGIHNNGKGGAVTVDNSTIAGNYAFYGGGIWNSGTLTARNGSTISGNWGFDPYTPYTGNGGGIYNYNGSVNISESYISGNLAVYGGGIYNSGGTVTVDSSTISKNISWDGGGIWNNATLTVQNYSSIYGNIGFHYGGGIYNYYGTVTVDNSNIYGNGAYYGGGIWNSGALNVQNGSYISGNYAYYSGGGIYNYNGTVNVDSSTISYNRAYGYYYSYYSYSGYYYGRGGGIYNYGGTVTLYNSYIYNNYAYYSGGGIWNSGTVNLQSYNWLYHNAAVKGSGGGIYNNGGTVNLNLYNFVFVNGSYYHGGGIYNNGGSVTINRSVVAFNYAYYGSGGGIWNNKTLNVQNGSYVFGNYADKGGGGGIYNYNGSVNVSDSSTVSYNYAYEGGGIFNNNGTVNVDSSTISDNHALNGAGGGINNWYGTTTVNSSTISGNYAHYSSGGGIRTAGAGSTLTVENGSTISGNYSIDKGGGISSNFTTVTIYSSTISDNVAAASSGGGISAGGGNMTINASTISGNTSYGYGGGIYNAGSSTITVDSSDISGNKAVCGGGVYNLLKTSTTAITNSTISGNTADNRGGGIASRFGSTITVTDSTISGNQATYGGGIINFYDGAVTVNNSTISGNTAAINGGGIINIYGGAVTVNNSTIAFNSNYGISNNGSGSVAIGHTIVADGVTGGISSNGFNLFNQAAVTGSGPTDILGGNADLLALADNGGPTLTHALGPYSDALDAGDPAAVAGVGGIPLYDQRGPLFPRVSGIINIGAFEGNAPPMAADDTDSTDEDTAFTTIDVLTNDTDPESAPLAVTAFDATGTKGTVTNNGDGTFDYDPNGQFDYLAVGENADDTFTYTVSDGSLTDTATVTITVTGVNDAPAAVDDGGAGFTTNKDTAITTANALTNDIDPDASDILAVSGLDTTGTKGLVTDNKDGTFDYNPNGQFDYLVPGAAAVDTFAYTISDSNGGTDTATVTITVTGGGVPVNTPPTARNDAYTTNEDTAFTTGNVLANDTDHDPGDILTVISFNTTGTKGLVTYNGNGAFNYNPNGQFDYLAAGETVTDTFTYTISDGFGGTDTATVTITVTGANDLVTARADNYTTSEDTAFATGNVLANDTAPDPSDILTVSAFNTTGTKGLVTDNGDGTFGYDPAGKFEYVAVGETATDTFTYTVSDGHGNTAVAQVTITITGVNDAPAAAADSGPGFTTSHDAAFTTGSVLANDTDPDSSDTLAVTSFDATGAKGLVTYNGDGAFNYDPNGKFEYLAKGETAIDAFTYTVSDGHGGTDTATVTITVTGAGEPAGWQRDFLPLDGDGHQRGGFPGRGAGSTLFSPGGRVMGGLFGQGHPNARLFQEGGNFSPGVKWEGPPPGKEGNDAPTANEDFYSTDEKMAFTTGNVLTNDTDPNPNDILAVTGLDTTGTKGKVTDNGNGTFGYDPNGQFDYLAAGETAMDTFTYTVSDGRGGTDTAQVTITITGVDDGGDNNAPGSGSDAGADAGDKINHEKIPAAPGFNEQLQTAAGRFENERLAFVNMLAGDAAKAA